MSEYAEDAMSYSPVYPGYVLTVGSGGDSVYIMQSYLNAIRRQRYGSLNKLSVDGIYGNGTKTTVMQYQTIKNLKSDGKIGPMTWDSIVREYNSLPVPPTDVYPGYVLRPGSKGVYVFNLQGMLNSISSVYPGVCRQTQDGMYGSNMSCSVRMFQKHFGLAVDGLAGEKTWNKAVEINKAVMDNTPPDIHTAYGGNLLSKGSEGDNVRMVQGLLDGIRVSGQGSWDALKVDGIYGDGTAKAVRNFQAAYNLKADGIVGKDTWAKLIEMFNFYLN